jgi:UDP-glucuronate 4-epimerase
MSILITGAAGFIGYHLSKRLIKDGFDVIGFDNLNNYYDKNLIK